MLRAHEGRSCEPSVWQQGVSKYTQSVHTTQKTHNQIFIIFQCHSVCLEIWSNVHSYMAIPISKNNTQSIMGIAWRIVILNGIGNTSGTKSIIHWCARGELWILRGRITMGSFRFCRSGRIQSKLNRINYAFIYWVYEPCTQYRVWSRGIFWPICQAANTKTALRCKATVIVINI